LLESIDIFAGNKNQILLESIDIFAGSMEYQAKFILDSGCTSHMVNSCNLLVNYHEFKTPSKIGLAAKSTSMEAVGSGSMSLKTRSGVTLKLEQVLFVPELSRNLLSVTAFQKKGADILFSSDGKCKLSISGKHVTLGSRQDKLFLCKLSVACEESASIANEKNSLDLWHRRLCHVSKDTIKLMSKKKSATGLPEALNDESHECTDCYVGKHTRFSFKRSSSENALNPGEVIVSDVCGPISPASREGFRYFATYTCLSTGYVGVSLLKKKSQQLGCMKKFIAMVETQLDTKVKRFRSDNGGEYVSGECEEFLKSKGILPEKTMPYSPESNGVAEKQNRTLLDLVRSTIASSGLAKFWWADILLHVVEVRNKVLHKRSEISPYELWWGKKPDITMFKVLGCKCWVRVPDKKRKKLDPKSEECVFVGLASDSKGYKCFNPITKKLVKSRDVIFQEDMPEISISAPMLPITETIELLPVKVPKLLKEDEESDSSEIGEFFDAYDILDPPDIQMDEPHLISAVVPEEIPNLRRTARVRNPPTRYQPPTNEKKPPTKFAYITEIISEPKSYIEAVESSESEQWNAAIGSELKSLLKNETYDVVTIPTDQHVIGCKWVFKRKLNEFGEVSRYKARLVALGYRQIEGIDYDQTFSPVVRIASLRLLIALAAHHGLSLHQFDVVTAFLNGDLKENVYMKQIPGLVLPTGMCLKLKKSLYGLKQSPRTWNETIGSYLLSKGFLKSAADSCIYLYKHDDKSFTILGLYVDDIPCAVKPCNLNWLTKLLQDKFETEYIGILRFIIGVQVEYDIHSKTVFLHQTKFAREILKEFKMESSHPAATPLVVGSCLSKVGGADCGDPRAYRSIIGKVMYLMTCTRPDLAAAVSLLSRYLSDPKEEHWIGVKRLLRYLCGTVSLGLLFNAEHGMDKLVGYSDADYASDKDSRKSVTGYVFILGNCVISWASKKQATVALSTAESEYMALSATAQEAIWLIRSIKEMKHDIELPVVLKEDNKACISIAYNPVQHSRTKHIDVRYHYIREQVEGGTFTVEYCPTKDMLADMLTKALPKDQFKKLRDGLNMIVLK
jgi:transposase InsO family protein